MSHYRNLSRESVEVEGYNVDGSGVIRSPGKFEGEPWWVPGLWDLALDGCADDETDAFGVPVSWFKVDDEFLTIAPEHRGDKWIAVYENDVGFVCRRFFRDADAPSTWGQDIDDDV